MVFPGNFVVDPFVVVGFRESPAAVTTATMITLDANGDHQLKWTMLLVYDCYLTEAHWKSLHAQGSMGTDIFVFKRFKNKRQHISINASALLLFAASRSKIAEEWGQFFYRLCDSHSLTLSLSPFQAFTHTCTRAHRYRHILRTCKKQMNKHTIIVRLNQSGG